MPEYMNLIDNGTYENMARYLKYYNSSSSVKDITSKLHLILMPDEYREINGIENEKIYGMWKKFAREVTMYNGAGKHEYMLAKDNVDENADIIFSIIDKIKF